MNLLKNKQNLPKEVDEIKQAKIVSTLSPNHPLESIINEWQCSHTLVGHIKGINCIALKPKNKSDLQSLIASGSRGEIKLWDLKSGELIRTLKGHKDAVNAVAISQDELIIASGSADKTIKLWHLETGELLSTFSGHSNTVTGLAFANQDNTLVSGSLDKTIKIWQRI